MSPNTAQLVVAHTLIASHPERIGYLPLLFDGEQDIRLDTENEDRNIGEWGESFSEIV
jgi:hypothetical protein